MLWISIILGIIEAIPGIIKLIQEIVAAIKGHPLQAAHEHAFMGLLAAWQTHQDPIRMVNELQSLKAKL